MRVGALLFQGDSIALIERQRGGERYYVIPGGGVEPGESPYQALVREVDEELGLIIRPGRLVAQIDRPEERQLYYLAEICGGEFGTGTGAEMVGRTPPPRGTYKPVWVSIAQLVDLPGWPRPLFKLIARRGEGDWPDTAILLDDPGSSPDTGDRRGP